jgi:ankyrin repeat protein
MAPKAMYKQPVAKHYCWPAHNAALDGKVDSLRDLLRADPGKRMEKCSVGHIPLHNAAKGGQLACVELLLEQRAEKQVVTASKSGWIPLMEACLRGQAPIARLLLRHSPDTQVLHASRSGWTALIFAAEYGHDACIQLLLEHSPSLRCAVLMSYMR